MNINTTSIPMHSINNASELWMGDNFTEPFANIGQEASEGSIGLKIQFWGEVTMNVLLMCLIIPSNTVVIAAPYYWKKLRTPDNILIVNLAVADLMTGTLTIGIITLSRLNDDIFTILRDTKFSCVLFKVVFKYLPSGVSLYTLNVMNIERYYAIRDPLLHTQRFGFKQVKLVVLSIWLYTFGITGIAFYFSELDYTIQSLAKRCKMIRIVPRWWLTFNSITVLMCLVIGTGSSMFIIKVVRRHNMITNMRRESFKQMNELKKSVNISVYLTLISTILWSTNAIAIIAFLLHSETKGYTWFLFRWVPLCLNAGLNAPVYAYIRKNNRKAYKYLLTSWPWHWNKLQQVMNTYERELLSSIYQHETEGLRRYTMARIQASKKLQDTSIQQDVDAALKHMALSATNIILFGSSPSNSTLESKPKDKRFCWKKIRRSLHENNDVVIPPSVCPSLCASPTPTSACQSRCAIPSASSNFFTELIQHSSKLPKDK